MADERTYTIPLRKEFSRAPKYKRTKRAVTALRTFVSKHMKTDAVRIGKHLNEHMWQRGNRHPPARVQVHTTKHEDVAYVELVGKDFALPKTEEPAKKEAAAPKKETTDAKKEEVQAEEKLTTAQDTVTTESATAPEKPKKIAPKVADKKVAEKKRSEKIVTESGK